MLPKPPRDPHKRVAYGEGWSACGVGRSRHDRPSYPTYGEREAFGQGWDDRQERIAYGYDERPKSEEVLPSS